MLRPHINVNDKMIKLLGKGVNGNYSVFSLDDDVLSFSRSSSAGLL